MCASALPASGSRTRISRPSPKSAAASALVFRGRLRRLFGLNPLCPPLHSAADCFGWLRLLAVFLPHDDGATATQARRIPPMKADRKAANIKIATHENPIHFRKHSFTPPICPKL